MATFGRIYADRREAGVELGRAVSKRHLRTPIVVLGLPRGGVPVAQEVAKALNAPLDVLIVRKVGMPGQPELAIGAVASGNIVVRERHTSSYLAERGIDFEQLAERQRSEVERRERIYRAGRPPLDLKGRTAILVDDGLATGSTMLAAVRAARKAGAAAVVVAAPVASREAHALVSDESDEVVILQTPEFLYAIGTWYQDFGQVEDEEVCRLLAAERKPGPAGRAEQRAAPSGSFSPDRGCRRSTPRRTDSGTCRVSGAFGNERLSQQSAGNRPLVQGQVARYRGSRSA